MLLRTTKRKRVTKKARRKRDEECCDAIKIKIMLCILCLLCLWLISLIVALIFLSFFAITFGNESKIRKDALDKIQEVISKEQELVSLGGQAAAAAHSLGTPLSTIKVITQELSKQLKDQKDVSQDIKLLLSQVERCNEILKRLSLNPDEED